MDTSFQPIRKRQLAELRGYVSWPVTLFRGVLFMLAVAAVAGVLAAAQRMLLPARLQHPLWWVVPTALLAAWLHHTAGRWTGGRAFRTRVRADLARGVVAVHRVVAVDAIEVEEQEDEGPAFFVLTADGRTILFAGQYLHGYKAKGFP